MAGNDVNWIAGLNKIRSCGSERRVLENVLFLKKDYCKAKVKQYEYLVWHYNTCLDDIIITMMQDVLTLTKLLWKIYSMGVDEINYD